MSKRRPRRRFDVYVLGSSIIVRMVRVSEPELAALGLDKGTMAPASEARQRALLDELGTRSVRTLPGGSGENTAVGIAQIGGRAAYAGSLGQDRFGDLCRESLARWNVPFTARPKPGPTGTCLVLVTPDGERTMRTDLGVSGELEAGDVDPELVAASDWLYLEGYLLAVKTARETAFRAMELARRAGARIALSFAAAFVVKEQGEVLRRAVREHADLVFANEVEATCYTGEREPRAALARLVEDCPAACLTLGVGGSYVSFDGERSHVPSFPARPIDLTGAGDLYAAGVLIGLTSGLAPRQAAELGSRVACRVVRRLGPRLSDRLRHELDALTSTVPA